jgi:hypothetical protein
MRWPRWLILMFLLSVAIVRAGMASVATFEATAPLRDHAAHSISQAFLEAVNTAVTSAAARGFSWVRISRMIVSDDLVAVQLLATDTTPEDAEEPTPGDGDEADAGLPVQAESDL